MSFISRCINYANEYNRLFQKESDQEKEPSKRKMRKQINSLENKVETLEDIIKSELYKEFMQNMQKLSEPLEVERFKKENKRLRQQVKSLKEIIKESNA